MFDIKCILLEIKISIFFESWVVFIDDDVIIYLNIYNMSNFSFNQSLLISSRIIHVASYFVFDLESKLLIRQLPKNHSQFPLAFTYSYEYTFGCSNDDTNDGNGCSNGGSNGGNGRNDTNTTENIITQCRQQGMVLLKNQLGIVVKQRDVRYVTSIEYQYSTMNRDLVKIKNANHCRNHIFVIMIDNKSINKDPTGIVNESSTIHYIDEGRLKEIMNDTRCFVDPVFRLAWGHFKKIDIDLFKSSEVLSDLYSNVEQPATEPTIVTTQYGSIDVPDGTIASDHIMLMPFSYTASMKGKGIRGQIVQLFQSILSSNKNSAVMADVVKVANVAKVEKVEKIIDKLHQASLVLDDIQDGSVLRRGLPSAHVKYGVPFSINAGVAALMETIQSVYLTDPAYTAPVMATVMDLHRGQGAELYWTHFKIVPSIEQLKTIMMAKTGALFKLGYTLLSISNDGNNNESTKNIDSIIQDWIDVFGVCYQINDDYINLTSPRLWKEKGFCDDFDEQKYSYPVVMYLNSHHDNANFKTIFHKPVKTIKDKERLLDILVQADVLDATRRDLMVYLKRLDGIVDQIKLILPQHHDKFVAIHKLVFG